MRLDARDGVRDHQLMTRWNRIQSHIAKACDQTRPPTGGVDDNRSRISPPISDHLADALAFSAKACHVRIRQQHASKPRCCFGIAPRYLPRLQVKIAGDISDGSNVDRHEERHQLLRPGRRYEVDIDAQPLTQFDVKLQLLLVFGSPCDSQRPRLDITQRLTGIDGKVLDLSAANVARRVISSDRRMSEVNPAARGEVCDAISCLSTKATGERPACAR